MKYWGLQEHLKAIEQDDEQFGDSALYSLKKTMYMCMCVCVSCYEGLKYPIVVLIRRKFKIFEWISFGLILSNCRRKT